MNICIVDENSRKSDTDNVIGGHFEHAEDNSDIDAVKKPFKWFSENSPYLIFSDHNLPWNSAQSSEKK